MHYVYSEALMGKCIQEEGGEDPRPEYKLLNFSFFCESGHCVPFDRETFDEWTHFVYAAGYIKPIYDESLDLEVST